MFSCFSGIAAIYAALLWFRLPGSALPGMLTSVIGLAGVTASACIYLVRARPAWNTKHTVADFHLTGAYLGPLLVASLGVGHRSWLVGAVVTAAVLSLLNQAVRFLWMTSSDLFELQASARLLSTTLASKILARGGLLILGGIVLPLLLPTVFGLWAALALALCGETLGRYLFFVSVVPKNMAASYLSARKVAA
jgi:DMSO reductase anchor subunit